MPFKHQVHLFQEQSGCWEVFLGGSRAGIGQGCAVLDPSWMRSRIPECWWAHALLLGTSNTWGTAQHEGMEGMELSGCGRGRGTAGTGTGAGAGHSLGTRGISCASSDLSRLLLLHLHTLQFLSWLCNCVCRVPASLPSSNPICHFLQLCCCLIMGTLR